MTITLPEHINKDLAVLVVDDLPSARRVVTRMLSTLGFTNVKEANNAAEARKSIEDNQLNLVITDLHLKDGLGTDLLTVPTTNSNKPSFVIITSDMDKDSFQKALQAGAVFYLLKPFSAQALVEKIGAALK